MKVSVLLPVYNGGDLLERAIDSVLGQDFEDFEFIIIDDASRDGSAELIRRKAAGDARIKEVLHEKNAGLAATLNEGLKLASAPYVARMDQDDESLPSRLRTQYVFMKSRPQVAVAGCFPRHMGVTPEMDRLVRLPVDAAGVKEHLQEANCLYHPSVMMDRGMVLKAGGYRQEFKNAEDYDLWLRLSREHDLVNIPVPLLRYHFTVSGMTLSRKWEQLYYVFLAQASFQHAGLPWPDIERIAKDRHCRQNKKQFLGNVLRATMDELLQLGWRDEALRLAEYFVQDLGQEHTSQVSGALLADTRLRQRKGYGWLDEFSSHAASSIEEVPPSGASAGSPADGADEKSSAFPARQRLGKRFGVLTSKRGENPPQYPLLIGLLMLPSVFWIAWDKHVWPWDQAWYGQVSIELWFNLTHHLSRWLPAMTRAFGAKAPGIAWLGQFFVPVGQLMGSVETGLLCSVLLAQVATLCFISKVGNAFDPRRRMVAWAGILAVASAPLFVAMSHQYFTESLQLCGVTYFYFLAVRARAMKREMLLANLFIATSIAMLAKITSPMYCLLPGAMAICGFFQKREQGEEKRRRISFSAWALFTAAAILSAGCAIWYKRNFQAIRDFARLSSSGDVALAYGHREAFLPKMSFWLHAMQISFQLPEVIIGQLILVAVAVVLFMRRPSGETDAPPRKFSSLDLLAIFSAVHILGALVVFSLNINEENRYLLPLLPAVATVTMWVLGRIRQPAIIVGVIALFCYQWMLVCAQALGLVALNPRVSYWLHPYDPDNSKKNEVTRLVDRTSTTQTAARMNMVGVEIPWLNANSLSFFAAKKQLHSRKSAEYTSLGYAEGDAGKAWDRLESLRIVYFISLDESALPAVPDTFNQVSASILKRIRGDEMFVREPFDSMSGVILFRNKTTGSRP